MSKPFSNYLFLDSGFCFLIKSVHQVQHGLTSGPGPSYLSSKIIQCPQILLGMSSKIRGHDLFFFRDPCPTVVLIFFVPGALGSSVAQALCGAQLGASHQILAGGQCIIAACSQEGSSGVGFLLFVTAAQQDGAFPLFPSGNDYKSGTGAGTIHVWDPSDGTRDLVQYGMS